MSSDGHVGMAVHGIPRYVVRQLKEDTSTFYDGCGIKDALGTVTLFAKQPEEDMFILLHGLGRMDVQMRSLCIMTPCFGTSTYLSHGTKMHIRELELRQMILERCIQAFQAKCPEIRDPEDRFGRQYCLL